jgi:hypothetical protein
MSPDKSRALFDELYSLDPFLEAHELRTFQREQAQALAVRLLQAS